MKILLITEFFPQDKKLQFTGGVEARTYHLARKLKKHHSVKVISRSSTAVPASFTSLFSRLTFVFKAIVKGLQSNPDLVEGSNFVSYLPAFAVAKSKHVPAVAWYPDVFIGTWKEKFGVLGLVGEWVERLSLKLPWDHFIALSYQTQRKLVKAGIDKKKITVVHAGVDQTETQKIKVNKRKDPTICCISRLVSYKRVSDLIKAFAVVKISLPQTQLMVIGTGPEEKNLRKLAKRLHVNSSVIWKKNLSRSQLLRALKSSHLFCLPSIAEGFGLVTLEAMAAGIPYVNADIGTNREITHRGTGGLLFKPKNFQDLAKKLVRFMQDKELYAQKVAAGKELVKHYSWQKSAGKTEAIYQSVVS